MTWQRVTTAAFRSPAPAISGGGARNACSALSGSLAKELKLAGMADIKAANRFISEVYLPDHNNAVCRGKDGLVRTPRGIARLMRRTLMVTRRPFIYFPLL